MAKCETCNKRKAPRGRDLAPADAGAWCTWECDGYNDEPKPPTCWEDEEVPREKVVDLFEALKSALARRRV